MEITTDQFLQKLEEAIRAYASAHNSQTLEATGAVAALLNRSSSILYKWMNHDAPPPQADMSDIYASLEKIIDDSKSIPMQVPNNSKKVPIPTHPMDHTGLSIFEEELTWILGNFKRDRASYAETLLAIEELIDRLLGLSALRKKALPQAKPKGGNDV